MHRETGGVQVEPAAELEASGLLVGRGGACTPKMTAACAHALRLPVTDLTGQPYVSSLKDEGLEEPVKPLWEAISNPMLPGFDDVPPRVIGEIAADLVPRQATFALL